MKTINNRETVISNEKTPLTCLEPTYNQNEAAKSLSVHLKPLIEAPVEDYSYRGLWRNHAEYRWYLMSSLVTDAGE